MFDTILDAYYRKAAEATAQFQTMLLQNWVQNWPQMAGLSHPGAIWVNQAQDFWRRWGETVTALLREHRETLDAQYRAGIRTIEDAFRVGEARDPAQFQRLTEELWKRSFETLRTVTEAQTRGLQDALQKGIGLMTQGLPGGRI